MTPPRVPESFQELGLAAEVVEALAAADVERPNALQVDALPVVRRGNDLVLQAGPGSGAFVATAAALLDHVPPDQRTPGALVVVPDAESARETARSLARMAEGSGHRVGALEVPWALPLSSGILVAPPAALLERLQDGDLDREAVTAVVVHGVASLAGVGALDDLDRLLAALPESAQKVLVSLPLGEAARELAGRHLRREIYLPAGAGAGAGAAEAEEARGASGETPRRGRIAFQVDPDPDRAAASAVARMLEDGARHVAVFLRTEGRMARVGETVALHGFECGAPGDAVPVWLAADDLEVRRLLRDRERPEDVATLSVDIPFDADSLDRRHGAGGPARVLARPRELPHLRSTAREAGYGLVPPDAAATSPLRRDAERFASRVEEVAEQEDVAPYLLLLEPALRRRSPEEVAAALALLLRRAERTGGPSGEQEAPRPPAWVRLFISIGDRDGVGPGDLLGAVTGEAGIDGSQVGKIEIRDNFSRIEVEEGAARRVLEALNGITFRGRSVRADYDRTDTRGRGSPGRGGRRKE